MSFAAVPDPDKAGPYRVGHTTRVLLDPSRNLVGDSIATGRPLFIHIWYPTNATSGPLATYMNNSAVYDPATVLPTGTTIGATYPTIGDVKYQAAPEVSPNGAIEGAASLRNTKFPLLIYSHGTFSAVDALADLHETLASQGFIVVAVEHLGNSANYFAAYYTGYTDTPVIFSNAANARIKDQDIRFAITKMLDSGSGFSGSIDSTKIGVYGYSQTSVLRTAGGKPGVAADPRVKAVGFLDVFFKATGPYSNVSIPSLIVAGDGSSESVPAFSGLPTPKYLARIAGAWHIPISFPGLCERVLNTHVAVNNYVLSGQSIYGSTDAENWWGFPSAEDIINSCGASIISGNYAPQTYRMIDSPNFLLATALDFPDPLRAEVALGELSRLNKWYFVSFFKKELAGAKGYDSFLTDSASNQQVNPLVDFIANCRYEPDNRMNIKAGDRITFTPSGANYGVTFSSGNPLPLEDKTSGNPLTLGDDDSVVLTLPFSFSMPNNKSFEKIRVSSNGTITTLIDPTYTAPAWQVRGELMLSGQATIAVLYNDMDPTRFGQVYAKITDNAVTVSWHRIPAVGQSSGAANTFQAVIRSSGVIELNYGALSGVGPTYDPKLIGTIGVVSGDSLASELRTTGTPVHFTDFGSTTATYLPFGTIHEAFYLSHLNTQCQ